MPKWLEINQDNLHIKFLALNLDFSSQYSDPLRLTRPAHAGVNEGYSLKGGYFTAIGLSSVNTLADKHRHAAYHKKH